MPILLEESSIYSPYDVYLNQISGDRFKYNQFHDKIKGLPENLQDFVFGAEPADFIKNRISEPLNLSETQTRETALVVMDLILANIYLGNIVSEVQKRLGIDDQKAGTMAGLIVAELFGPILEELKKEHIEKFAKNTPQQKFQNQNNAQNNQSSDDRTVDLKNSKF